MQTINYEIHAAKSAVPGVDRKDLHETLIVVPPRNEQQKIVAFIESENEKFDALNFCYSRQLTLLTEYRAALIHECVTGQRAVPESVSE
jgi:type I restriction enzyme S subunit